MFYSPYVEAPRISSLKSQMGSIEAHRQKKLRLAERRAKGLKVAQLTANFLKKEYGVTRFVLFGSMMSGNIREESDIDLAVWGLPPILYFQAWAAVNDKWRALLDLWLELYRTIRFFLAMVG